MMNTLIAIICSAFSLMPIAVHDVIVSDLNLKLDEAHETINDLLRRLNLNLRNPSMTEFQKCHDEWATSKKEYSKEYDCDDFALDYQQAFLKNGFICNIQVDNYHTTNTVFISDRNMIIEVEPQTGYYAKIAEID